MLLHDCPFRIVMHSSVPILSSLLLAWERSNLWPVNFVMRLALILLASFSYPTWFLFSFVWFYFYHLVGTHDPFWSFLLFSIFFSCLEILASFLVHEQHGSLVPWCLGSLMPNGAPSVAPGLHVAVSTAETHTAVLRIPLGAPQRLPPGWLAADRWLSWGWLWQNVAANHFRNDQR